MADQKSIDIDTAKTLAALRQLSEIVDNRRKTLTPAQRRAMAIRTYEEIRANLDRAISAEERAGEAEFEEPIRDSLYGSELNLLEYFNRFKENNNGIDGIDALPLDQGVDSLIKEKIDSVFLEYGITTDDAKREVFARLYQNDVVPAPESEILRLVPETLQPKNPYGRTFADEEVKAARRIANRYSYERRKGRTEFTDAEMTAVRAAWRVVGTRRQQNDPSP